MAKVNRKVNEDGMDDSQRVDLLERVLRSYCPNDGVSYKSIDKMILDKETNVINVLSAIYDGLAYGNWPWIVS